ncbi:MAG: hypothetical protein AAFX50_24385 [Acidobacteriota bacterium]
MTWHARMAVDLYLLYFPDLRFDEAEIRRHPGPLRAPGALEQAIFGHLT